MSFHEAKDKDTQPPPGNFDYLSQINRESALDARIAELTRRRAEISHGATGNATLADFAAADSFAQAFVDRWARSNGGDGVEEGAGMRFEAGPSATGGMGTNPGLDLEYLRQSWGNPMTPSSFHSRGSMDTQALAAAQFRRMSAGFCGGGGAVDLATAAAALGMHYRGMGNRSMNMAGAAAAAAAAVASDCRNPKLFINSMEGAQAFQNWQMQQQMKPAFISSAGMGMMGGDFPNVGGEMLMSNNQSIHPGMMQGMNHPSIIPTQQNQQQGKTTSQTSSDAKARGQTKRSRAPPPAPSSIPTEDLIEASKGPFKALTVGVPLALEEDKDWLTPLHCFVRRHCVEAFTATTKDVQAPSKGKRKPIQVGQVGIRCPHCHIISDDSSSSNANKDYKLNIRERGSVYYPTSLSSIYNATMNLLQRHIHSCTKVPKDIMDRYHELKKDDARSGTSKRYWIESAKTAGLVDTMEGIRLSARVNNPPIKMGSLDNDKSCDSGKPNADKSEEGLAEEKDDGSNKIESSDGKNNSIDSTKENCKESVSADAPPLVLPSDEDLATAFSFLLLSQMQPCVFTEADRLGKRKGLPIGFAGLACRHCFGGYGSGRFFPSSIKTLSDTSKTLNVLHNHMMRCRNCPKEIITELARVRESHDDERSKMKFGSQKAFFGKIWSRLHDNRPYDPMPIRIAKTKSDPNDGSISNASTKPDTPQYPVALANNDMAFMANSMMCGPSQYPNVNMGMITHPDMMMRGYTDQFRMGAFNVNHGLSSFCGGAIGNDGDDVSSSQGALNNKRALEEFPSGDPNEMFKRMR